MKINNIKYILLTYSLLNWGTIVAQFSNITTTNSWESPNVDKIGVGNFGGTAGNVLSALHIDGSALNTTTGEVFRTNAPNSTATYWRMFRNVSGTPTEFGTLSNPGNDNHFYVGATNGSGDLRFQSGGANTRMTVASGGNVGIGTTSPSNLLHVYNSNTGGATYSQLSNGNATYTNGLLVGINTSNEGVVNMKDNKPLKFYTGNTQRMHISSTGDVAIGTNFSNPNGRLHQFVSGANDNFHFFETGTSGAFNFFRIGLTASGTAELNIESNWPMNFFTNNTQRMTILGSGEVGINNISPGSKLEISSGTSGVSGLQFTDLTSSYSPGATASKFLTVASDGKVILRDESGSGSVTSASNGTSLASNVVQLGQNVSGSGGQLTSSREIPLNDNNIFFTEPATPNNTDNGIGIGIGTTIDPTVRLDVSKSTQVSPAINVVVAGRFAANCTFDDASNDCTGIIARAEGPASTTQGNNFIGGKFTARGFSTYWTAAVDGEATGDQTTVAGGKFDATGTNPNGGGSWGVYCTASGSQDNRAVFGIVSGSKPTNWAGYFVGDVTYTGTLVPPSDSTIKSNISQLNNISPLLNQLTPHSYTFNHSVYPQLNLPNGVNYGLISQEVAPIFPELVKEIHVTALKDSNGVIINQGGTIKGLNYTGLIPLLLQGWKEQQQAIADLTSQLNQLQNQINSCCGSTNQGYNENHNRNSISIDLANAQTIILDQNVPNPFAEQTTINYFLPDDVSKAQIIFYNNQGNVLRIVDLNEKGKGELNVFAADLSSGIYTYTLIADGKVIETKKMIKQ